MKKGLLLITGSVVALILLGAALVLAATNTTFSKPLVGSEYGTRGTNQKLEMQKAVDTEIRTRINGIAAFVGYSSAS